MTTRTRLLLVPAVIAMTPFLGGAKGGGCGAVNSRSEAPDVAADWAIRYDDTLGIELTIGGAVYTEEIPATGGSFTIDHDGQPITFDLDCDRPEVVCPSEQWPAMVSAVQRNATFAHRMWVTIPHQECNGATVAADPAECGADTNNPDCADVCMGEMETVERETFGVINEPGDHFDLLLGAGVATNGINCALLGVSSANADLTTTGSAETGDWRAESMDDGHVVVAYTGGCLWVGDPDMDMELQALVIGASVKFTTGFTGTRVD